MTKESEQSSSQKLFNHLYEACNILRGPLNQDEYRNYLIPLLFFKRISDVYDEEVSQALEESGNDREYAALPEQHSFVVPEGCHWSDVRDTAENVGAKLVSAMNGIETANPNTLMGLFSSFDEADWTNKEKLSDERLKDLIEHMSKIKVGNNDFSNDVMGQAYEFLLKKFADLSKKNAGEFYTPRPIVKLMIDILDPKPGETVYDPACGTGGMLIEAIHHMRDRNQSFGKIYGQEKKLETSSIARMNLFLHGASDFKIATGDTLRHPSFLQGGSIKTFNCVVANPPFSLDHWGADAFSSDPYGRNIWGSPTDSNADMAWLQHMVKSMDPNNGRVAVILPQGVLFREHEEAKIRQKLVESDLLDTVIALPTGVFFRTGVAACILFLTNRKKMDHKDKVYFIDASKEFVHRRAQNIMEPENINNVFSVFQKYESIKEKSAVVSRKEIAEHGYSLSVTEGYIEREKKAIADPKQVRKEYFDAIRKVKESEAEVKRLIEKGDYLNGQD